VSSRRLKLLLPWVSAAVLLAGIGTFVGVHLANTAAKEPGLSSTPVKVPKAHKQVSLPDSARRVAGEFILTAVARKQLDRSWALAHPTLREGFTRKEWDTGDIPVVPYQVGKINEANFKVDYAYPNEAQIELVLVPKKGVRDRPHQFMMGLRKWHSRWTVDLWQPLENVGVFGP
jgi:hypothetical protein